MYIGDAVGVRPAELDGIAAAVDDVAGVETEVDVPRVGGVEDTGDLLGRLDVGVPVRVQHHPEAVLVQQHPAQGVGVLDVEPPGVIAQDAVVGPLPGLVVTVQRRQVDDVLGADGGVCLGDLAEVRDRLGPGLGLVQDAPAGARHDAHAVLVAPLLQLLRVLGEVSPGARLDDVEPGLGHLLPGLAGRHLLRIVGEPHPPLVRAHADGELRVPRIVRVACLRGHCPCSSSLRFLSAQTLIRAR